MLRGIRNIFITGFLVILPIAGSLYIMYLFFSFIENLFDAPLKGLLGIEVPGVGVILTFTIIFVIGIIARNYFGKRILHFTEKIIIKIPLVKTFYISIKQIVDTLFLKKNEAFKKAVLVEYPKEGIYTVGFITSEAPKEISEKTKEECISLFIPTTPNPTSGMFIIVPRSKIVYLDMDVEEAIKLIVSGGLVTPGMK
ncbi:DUF502 domain-containing protein [Caloranaerobacter azorensis]|uniref:Transporter n=2 Tax=Caloranaerobacter azorensis TaxID=116090 RepID=A0A096BH02_9FIRM|nr:DUF502 domain-containing protein [Caloranaerobacter azorensis]KGG80157.1 hypothetical protein Y919_07835 [Caloranaerobacter azorensis H53214]QIB26304.1 DUF502 domain-containing protein [Caloranaerobacter azorensis]